MSREQELNQARKFPYGDAEITEKARLKAWNAGWANATVPARSRYLGLSPLTGYGACCDGGGYTDNHPTGVKHAR